MEHNIRVMDKEDKDEQGVSKDDLEQHDPQRGDIDNTEPRANVPPEERWSKDDIHRQRQMPHLGDRTPEMRSGYDDPADHIDPNEIPHRAVGAPDTSAPGELPEENEE